VYRGKGWGGRGGKWGEGGGLLEREEGGRELVGRW